MMGGIIVVAVAVVLGLAVAGFVKINKAWSCLFRQQKERDL